MDSIVSSGIREYGEYKLDDFHIADVTIPQSRTTQIQASTPSSLGVLRKFNIHHDKSGLLYVKSGYSRGTFFSIDQPLSEKIACEIGELLGFNVVHYKLWIVDLHLFLSEEEVEQLSERPRGQYQGNSFERLLADHHKVLVSVSQSFKLPHQEFASCDVITDKKGKELYKELTAEGLDGGKKNIDQMIVFDYIIHNTDRHKKNFGFIVDRKEGKFPFAPLFDHGLAFCSEFSSSDIANDGQEILGFSIGKPFTNLSGALDLVDKDSLQGINLNISIEEVIAVINKYAPLMSVDRAEFIKQFIARRYKHVQGLFSQV
ncbi:HipA domain-containing protein [Paenibacillus vandeheii]